MEKLRIVITWINKHKFLSTVAVFIGIIAIILIRHLMNLNEGELTAPLKKGNIVQAVYGIGTVTATHSLSIKPGIVANINELFVKEGDSVKKGSKLAQIDRITYTAPFDGTVTYLPFKVGENVFAQLPMITIVNLQDRYMVVSMEQQGALQVEKGQKVKMNFDSQRETTYDGVVEALYANDSNFLARINVSMLSPKILPGMTADVAIEVAKHENVLLVPVAALQKDSVWVKRGSASLPKLSAIKIGVVDKEMAEVLSGDIQEGDVLVIKKKAN